MDQLTQKSAFNQQTKRSSSSNTGLWFDIVFLSLIPIILNVPNHIGTSGGRTLSSLALLTIVFKNLILLPALSKNIQLNVNNHFKRFFSKENKLIIPTTILIALLTIAELRGFENQVATPFAFFGQLFWMTSICASIFASFAPHHIEDDKKKLILAFISGLPLYIIINVLLFILGFKGGIDADENGANKLMSMVGISMSRATFILGGGLNNFGLMAGLCTTVGIILSTSSEGASKKFIGLASVVAGLIGVAMADTRGALLMTFVIYPIIFITKHAKNKKTRMPIFLFILPIIPLVGVLLIPIIESSGVAALFQREGAFASRLGIASGRDIVWGSVLAILKYHEPVQFIGYGVYGQFVSGATKGYSWIFAQVLGFTGQSTHNASFQYIIDIGYIGAFLWLFWMYRILKSTIELSRSTPEKYDSVWLCLFGTTLFIIFGGITEAAGTQYLPDSFSFLLMTPIICGSFMKKIEAAPKNHFSS